MTFADNDVSLSTADTRIIEGGSTLSCGVQTESEVCGDIGDDFTGAARTLPYSMGAIEKD